MRYLTSWRCLAKDLLGNRRLIVDLAKKDFQKKYLGSYLGILWGFIQPMVNILIFWFVFQVGFKVTPIDDFPFILWLSCGMIPWFFFSDAISNATGAFIENSYLIKHIVFKISVLPIIKVISSLFVHLFFIIFLFIMFQIYGYKPDIYNLQIFYYLICTFALVLSISLITSSIVVFVKDIGQTVAMVLQILFWVTPIFWNKAVLAEKYKLMLTLNPLYYITDGYRNAFIYHQWFWQDMQLTLIFWGFTFITFVIGVILYRRLKPHFADVI